MFTRYKAFDPEAQVTGQSMIGFYHAIDRDVLDPLLRRHGLGDLQPERWYPMQSWLDVLSDIHEEQEAYSTMLTFTDIGQKVGANLILPENAIRETGFVEWTGQFGGQSYRANHRGNVGSYLVEKVADNQLLFKLTTPYPPDFWYGLMYGVTRRFCKSFKVQFEDIEMRSYTSGKTIRLHILVN